MIYLVKAEGTNLYKIGYTDGKAEKRVKTMQTGCPHKLSIIEEAFGDMDKEKFLHNTFSEQRKQGEWFEFDDDLIQKVVDKIHNATQEELCIEKIDSWIEVYESWTRDSRCNDSRLEHFIELAIMYIMRNNGDMAIQRLLEFKEILFSGSRLKYMPELTERISNTR